MNTKICFKCGTEKPSTEFYPHPMMGDGRLNKCKECTKIDVKKKYDENINDLSYIEKERERCREKYRRLKYKDKYPRAHSENANTSRHLKNKGLLPLGHESHHWNYNLQFDVFILSRRAHKLVHKFLEYEPEIKLFINTINGELLDTKEKHKQFILDVFSENKVDYEVKSYTEILTHQFV